MFLHLKQIKITQNVDIRFIINKYLVINYV